MVAALPHPNGREYGEGVYVAATDNVRARRATLLDWISTNATEARPITAVELRRMFAWMLWKL